MVVNIAIIVALVLLFLTKIYFERKAIITNFRMEQKIDAIYELASANMEAQLTVASVALRRVADMTKDPMDLAIASQAETKLTEHTKKRKSDPPIGGQP